MRWISLLAFSCRVFASSFDEVAPSSPDEIASLNADLLVDGFVSVASGQISLAIEKVDPEGAKTEISYKEGNQLLEKTTKNPKGATCIETYNAHGLLLKKEVPGCTLEEYSYDRLLRLATQDHLAFTYTPEGFRSSLIESGQKATFWTYTPGGKIQSKIKPDGTVLHYEYTEDGDLAQVGSREFYYDDLGRVIGGTGFSREYDLFGNVIKEKLATGLDVSTSYDDFDRPIQRILPDQSSILYEYDGPHLIKISRLNAGGDLLYAHNYDQFDLAGRVLSETGFFNCRYRYDKAGRRISQTSPFFSEELTYDEAGNLIRKGAHSYAYDAADQLILSSGQFSLKYDKHYNRIAKNDHWFELNALNRVEGLSFDENGCLLQEGFAFDEFDQLIQANGEKIIYDALGRRIQKGNTSYLYFGDEEVGAFERGEPKELKISGSLAPVALEIDNKPYYPIADVQAAIRVLIDPKTSKVCRENRCDPFGAGLNSEIPYAYSGKRYDAGSGLVYFGKRYYIPAMGRWLTPDPIGPIDHSNLYQYVFNNPYRFQDPNGESIGGYLLGLGEIALGGTIMLGGFALEVVTVGGFTVGLGMTTSTGAALMGLGLATTTYHAQHIKTPEVSWKNTEVYTPDRPLPLTEDGIPIPDTDEPHTQLGIKGSKRRPGEKYPQAREFGKDGKPIKTIDFTDHGEPLIHPNPHEHPYEPNQTGGTPKRGDPQPLKNWEYYV